MEEKRPEQKIEEIKQTLENFNNSINFRFFYSHGRQEAFLPSSEYLFLKTQIEHIIEPKKNEYVLMPKFSQDVEKEDVDIIER